MKEQTYYIYRLTCRVNGKSYIGVTNNLKRRLKEHKWSANHGSSYLIHYAMRKYGVDVFEMTILDETPDRKHAFEMLEPRYIAESRTNIRGIGYNLTAGGDGQSGYFKSEVTKEKIRQTHLGVKFTEERKTAMQGKACSETTKEKIRQTKLGKIHSDIAKEHMRQAQIGRIQSEVTKEKIRQTHLGRPRSEEHNANMKRVQNSPVYKEKMKTILIGNKRALGYRHSEETVQKMTEAQQRIGEQRRQKTKIFEGKPCKKCSATIRYMSNNVCVACMSHRNSLKGGYLNEL